MKLSYLIPEGQYEFFGDMVAPLRQLGIEVYVNDVYNNQDLILAAILPVAHEWIPTLKETKKPFILWHWDLYSFVDYREPRWKEFLELLPEATDIWSCTYEVARQLKELKGLDSYMMPAWVENLPYNPKIGEPYVFYAASSGAFGKRMDWAERACRLLGYKFVCTTGQCRSREEYHRLLSNCRVYLMPAFEESNATIPAQEAAVMGRPVVLADIPGSREVFGSRAYYFQPNDFRDLLRQLENAWAGIPKLGARDRILDNYGDTVVIKRIVRRLKQIHAEQQTGPW
jgi:glycosyltransferase involved in cell wall biosynthesis